MNTLIKVNPSVAGFAYILERCMSDAFSTEDEKLECVEDYAAGKCELWTVPKHGFIVVAVLERCEPLQDFTPVCGIPRQSVSTGRVLEVEYGAGKMFYNRRCIALLDKMAAGYGCGTILAYTRKPGVVRLLERQGFSVVETHAEQTTLEKAVSYGQQVEKLHVVND